MKRASFLSALVSCCLVLFVGYSSGQNMPGSPGHKMAEIFQPYNSANGPGCAVAVVKDGKVVYGKGFGMANLEYDIPITENTVFDVASLSKEFTGYAISVLEQEGKISMTDDVRKYLPEVPVFGKTITVGHLVHHTSGLRDWPQVLKAAGWREDEVFTMNDIMQMVKRQRELDFEPGEKYAYTNTGYNLLAAIVEKVSRQSFPEWMQEHVFKPLGMHSSFFLTDHKAVIKHLAYAYTLRDSSFVKAPGMVTAYGSNCLITSVNDLAKWAIHFEKKLAAKDPVYVRMLEDGVLNNGEKVHYGYGLATADYRGAKMVMHTGRWGSYQTYISMFPDEHFALIVFSNASNFTRDRCVAAVTDLFLGKRLEPLAKTTVSYSPSTPVKLDTALARQYAGTYQLGPRRAVTYTLEKGRLMAQHNGDEKFALEPVSANTFWGEAFKSYITFFKDSAGNYNLVEHQSIRAKRISPWRPNAAHLDDYAGAYYSPELEAEYRVDAANGQLVFHSMRIGDSPLVPDPVIAEQFTSAVGEVHFLKNEAGEVAGFSLSGNRVKQIRFDKRRP